MVGLTILIRKVKESTDIWKFINVLKPEVWYCILGAYFLSSLLLWGFDRYLAISISYATAVNMVKPSNAQNFKMIIFWWSD